MRSLFAAMRKGRKRKRGASLAMVLVSMTVLTIMGTLFTTIAMRSYQYSYSRLCRQQAYYTASSSVESFYNYVSSNPNVLSVMITQLNDACEGKVSADEGAQTYATIDPTTVRLKVGSTGGGAMTGDTVSLVPNGFFDLYLGSCTLWVRFNNTDRTEISVEAEATYNGYSETVRAIIARTNGAASELKKIFDNTFCLQSPITTIVADSTYGDVYVSQPLYGRSAGTLDGSNYHLDDYDEVVAGLTKNGEYKEGNTVYKGKAGQYLRDASGNIVTGNSKVAHYNAVLKDGVYGKAQASTADGSLMGHTKPIDFDNTPMDSGFYNDWVELYMFSANDGGTIVDGNLYADSKILIGLVDRDQNNRDYIRIWDNDLKRAVYPRVAYNYNGTESNESWRYKGYDAYFKDGNFKDGHLDPNFEHGFGKDVFFDHQGSEVLARSRSKFRINGDMYLWEDARIENFDSTKTENKEKGIKNNIYAAKNLYIDGLYISDWQRSDNIVYEQMKFVREVDIYGDVIVYGDAYISGANIEGNVYCFGEELIMTETNVKGNVYFCGSSFTGDHLYVDGNVVIADDDLNDLANKGYNTGVGTFGAAADVGGTASKYRWGAVFQNCDVLGTLWSNVNTHIVVGKSERNMLTFKGDPYASIHGNNSDVYGDIIVDAYLFIDLAQGLDVTGSPQHVFFPYKSNYLGNVDDKYHELAERNGITYDGSYDGKNQVIYAERLQIRLNQSDAGSKGRRSFFGDIYVGDGNCFIDGNASDGDRNDAPGGYGYNGLSIYIAGLYSKSQGKIYDTTISGSINNDKVKRDPWYERNGFNHNNKDVAAGERIQDNVGGAELDGALIGRVGQGTISDHFKLGDVESAATAARNNFTDPLWKEKLIKIRTWSAPVAGNKTEFNLVKGLIVKYVGETLPEEGGGGNNLFGHPNTTDVADYITQFKDAFEVTDNGNTLIISDSVTFNCFADFSAYKRVIFDTSEGNIYVKFLYGAEFGKAQTDTSSPTSSEVVLTGGNMVFWHLYQEGNYDVDHPTLAVNPYTNVGIVTASSGAGRGNDGLYIVSNDDALITFGQNAVLNGYLYAPHGHIFFAPSAEHATFTVLNGCMAIESLVMLTTADQSSQSWWDKFWNKLWGGWDSTDIIDSVIEQYGDLVFNYVQPPLITDSVLMGGLTDQEVTDFNSVVWEFLGYY